MTNQNKPEPREAYKDNARMNIMMALEAAKAIEDEMLIYLLRMALEQLNSDGTVKLQTEKEQVVWQ